MKCFPVRFLKKLGGEKIFKDTYTVTIGIYDVPSPISGRYLWLPVAIANYLTAVKRKRVAIVELSQAKALDNLAMYFNRNIGEGEYFELFGVRYYPCYKEKLLPKLLKENINYIIFDGLNLFGSRSADMTDYAKKLLVGSLKAWEAEEYKSCMNALSKEGDRGKYYFLAEYFDKKEIRQAEKDTGKVFVRIPAELNPFRIKRSEFEFFETFL